MPNHFDLTRLVHEVSEDAAALIQLTIGTPMDILLAGHELVREVKATTKRAVLIDFLLEVGWSAARISICFHEISEALP